MRLVLTVSVACVLMTKVNGFRRTNAAVHEQQRKDPNCSTSSHGRLHNRSLRMSARLDQKQQSLSNNRADGRESH